MKRSLRLHGFLCLAALLAGGCQGGGAQGSLLPGGGMGQAANLGNVPGGATVVRVHVPGPGASPGAGANGGGPGAPPPLLSVAGTPTPLQTPMPTPGVIQSSGSTTAASMTLSVAGPTPVAQTMSLAAGAPGCVAVTGGQVCQSALPLSPGTYLATVTMYASQNASPATAIGGPQTIAFTVAPGTPNVVNLTPVGTVSQIDVVPASALSAENAQDGIDLFGAGKHQLVAELLDVNNNIIIQPSVPSFAIVQTGGAPFSIGVPAPSSPNVFSVAPSPGFASNIATLRITASFSGQAAGTCSQPGAACTGSVALDVRQLLAVANAGANTVALYAGGQNVAVATIQNGISGPAALVFDSAGNLFVANQLGSVAEYTPPYVGPPTTIAVGVNHPQALALDGRANLFVANGSGSNTVTEYSPPYSGAPLATISNGIGDPVSLGVDASSDLFVANQSTNTVTEYAAPYSVAPTTLSNGLNGPNSLALDSRGDVFVSNLNSTPNSVVEFGPPFSSGSVPKATITNGVNEQGAIALNPGATLFVPNQGSNSVTAYAAPYGGAPATIVGGQSQPVALAIDLSGNLYVANYGNNTVTVYSMPYVSGSWTTLSYGISGPQALALSPPTAAAGVP